MGVEQELRAEIRQLRSLLDIAQRAGRVAPREPAPKAKALQLNLPNVVQYPLADFAEGRGRAVPLPDSMVERDRGGDRAGQRCAAYGRH